MALVKPPSRSWGLRDRLFFYTQEDPSGCWLWLGPKHGPYGRVKIKGKSYMAHRVVYEEMVGPIPEGLTLDHCLALGCTNTLCVRPSHMDPCSRGENSRRGGNGRKTHCAQGHEYTDENTYVTPRGWRRCLDCKRAWGRAWMKGYRRG